MCGFLAVTNLDVDQAKKDRALLRMWHRGPDQGDQWQDGENRVWLGHRRLSIVDLSDAGRQPMHSADGALSIVFNGEIYNYPSLRQELTGRGCQFVTRCDTEVLLHAYQAWGLDMFSHLQGMFAFVLWDKRQRRLLAARDHLGIKPLFYAEVKDGTSAQNGFVFGSDLDAMQVLLPTSPTPNPMALSYLLTLGFVTEPHTMWREIQRLPAGHYLCIDDRQAPVIRRYWEPPRALIEQSAAATEEEWRHLFETVVQEHLLADTPIALFLSGGLDSTAVAACLHDLKAPLETLTVGFPGAKRDESELAAATSQHLGLSHRIFPLDRPDPLALIREVSYKVDEPMGASGPLSKFKICQAAQESGYKVVFGGDGGDEVFCGYPRFFNMQAKLSPFNRQMRPLLRWAVERFGKNPRVVNTAADAYGKQDSLSRHRWRMYPRYLAEETERLLAPMGHRFSDADMLAPYLKHYEPNLPMQRAMQRIDLMTYCADGELARIDKVSMAHSLEWRVPMLDRRVVEFGLSRPYSVAKKEQSKPIIRQYLDGRIPESILKAPKRGFSIDNMDALDLTQVTRIINEGPWVKQGYWSKDWQTLIQPEMPYRLARVFLLLSLTLWAENQHI